MAKFETLKTHKLATGLAIFAGALTAFNAIGPLDDMKDDAFSGGGDFQKGEYNAQTYFLDIDRQLFGGRKEFSCEGKRLILRSEVVNLSETLLADNGQTYREEVRKNLGLSPACSDNTLTDSDAAIKFWRD